MTDLKGRAEIQPTKGKKLIWVRKAELRKWLYKTTQRLKQNKQQNNPYIYIITYRFYTQLSSIAPYTRRMPEKQKSFVHPYEIFERINKQRQL